MSNNYYTIETTPELQGQSYSLWQPEGATNRKIQVDTGISSNWKYRQYMQQNAKDIMKYNTMQSIYTSGNNPYTLQNTEQTNTSPFLYNSVHDSNNPSYGYRNSDLKQDYMTKEQMRSRMVAPSISTEFFK